MGSQHYLSVKGHLKSNRVKSHLYNLEGRNSVCELKITQITQLQLELSLAQLYGSDSLNRYLVVSHMEWL